MGWKFINGFPTHILFEFNPKETIGLKQDIESVKKSLLARQKTS